MRPYEIMMVLQPELSEEGLAALLETIQGWIETNGGQIKEVKHWGRRRLAYMIKNFRDGYYLLYKLDLPHEAPAELERMMRINEDFLRFLVIREDE